MRRCMFVLGFAVALCTVPALAQEPMGGVFGDFSLRSSKEPVEIHSNQLYVNAEDHTAIFRGNVEVVQGSITMDSDVLTVTYAETEGRQEVREIQAEGNVRISQGPRRATGGRAVFDQSERVLRLTENATLVEGSNQISGDTILVYPDESRMEVSGTHRRVKVILFPGEEGPSRSLDQDSADEPASPPAGDATQPSEASEADGSDGR